MVLKVPKESEDAGHSLTRILRLPALLGDTGFLRTGQDI